MAGARIVIDATENDVLDALNELLRRTSDPTPAFEDIGKYLLISRDDRWGQQEAPDGSKWAPLSGVTLSLKTQNRDKILVETGHLRVNSLSYFAEPTALLFGTSAIYGAVHQFGAKQGDFGCTKRGTPIPWSDIPARPFLGISNEGETEILDIIQDYLAELFG